MGAASIYGLFDADGALRYIGKANDPQARLKSHLRDCRRRKTPLYDWINKHGVPEMRVLEANCEDWRESERRLIAEARQRGEKLLNVADGGDEPFCPIDVRRDNARKLVDMMRDDPVAAAMKEQIRRLSFAHKLGQLSEFAISCMRECYERDPKTFKSWCQV